MKATVKCKVPTIYQLGSFTCLTGTCPSQSPGGGYYFEKLFPTVEDGKQFMRDRAFSLLENDGFTNEEYRAPCDMTRQPCTWKSTTAHNAELTAYPLSLVNH